MKKLYSMLIVLMGLLFGGATTALAQEEMTLDINMTTGDWTDWNKSASTPFGKKWETNSEDPHVVISCANNNMSTHDGKNLKFYDRLGSTSPYTYNVSCTSPAWYISAVSFDFFSDTYQGHDPGIIVNLCNLGDEECYGTTADDAVHVEISELTEDDVVSFTVGRVSDEAASQFANVINFKVTLTHKTGPEVARAELSALLQRYNFTEDDFPVGTEPGFYGEAEATAFFAALESATITAEESEDEAELKAAATDLKNKYEALVASKVAYNVTNGLYRFRTGMTYNDGETKYLLAYGINQALYWGTPGDAEDNLAAIWRVTKSGANYDIVSMMNNGRVATIPTSSNATLTTESGTLMAIDVAGNDGVNTYVNLRLSTGEEGAANYLHQGGHGGGANSSGSIVGWYSTYANGAPAASEWVLEPVSESELQTAQSEYAVFKQRVDFENEYKELLNKATADLITSQAEMESTNLITDAEQLSSPWSDSAEGTDLGALIDEDPATYWHSDWHSGNQPNHTHYLQVALNEPVYDLVRLTITRRAVTNDHITKWSVYGSNDPEADDDAWELLAVLATPFGKNTETISSLAFDAKQYTNLRCYIDGTTTGRGYGHVSEFQICAVVAGEGSQYAALGQSATTLNSVITELTPKAVSEITQDDYTTLKTAYENFKKAFVDPTELRDAIAAAEPIANGFVVGNDPGCWSDATAANALKKTISDAKAYDEAGEYTPATSNSYITTLNQQKEALIAAANTIAEGKWYRIKFATDEEFETYEWDPVAGNAPKNNEEVETAEALWGKFVTVATSATEDGFTSVYVIDAADVRLGQPLFFDAEDDIENADMALFRFVKSGESYLLQNKATGLFLKAAGTSGAVTLNIQPSFFNVTPIGYGLVAIAATGLDGSKQSYLHGQISDNRLVTWDVATPGSRSGLHLVEAGDASSYNDPGFTMDIREGQYYTMCYPAGLTADQGQMYTVGRARNKEIILCPISEAKAGEPVIYINGSTEDYDAENGTEEVTFRHSYEFAAEPQNTVALRGTYSQKAIGGGFIVANGNKFEVTTGMGGVLANQAYIESDTRVTTSDAITITIDAQNGIAEALSNVAKSGAIYTIDGRLVSKRGNINTIKSLGRGIYILNGTKVAVK